MAQGAFAGDKKAPMRSPLAAIEKQLIQANVARFPPWLEGYHLTMLTIPWTLGLILFGYLARHSLHWLWLSSIMLAAQWFTDSFDGALGRHRERGLVKWGFFMDHLLDFFFMSAIFIGYAFILEGRPMFLMLFLMLVYQGMNVNSWLSFACTNEFKITYLGMGPTEVRLLFIVVNTLLIFCGKGFLIAVLPYALLVCLVMLCAIVYRNQRRFWKLDMDLKKASSDSDRSPGKSL